MWTFFSASAYLVTSKQKCFRLFLYLVLLNTLIFIIINQGPRRVIFDFLKEPVDLAVQNNFDESSFAKNLLKMECFSGLEKCNVSAHLTDGGKHLVLNDKKAESDRIAIIVPYRDRPKNLQLFLSYMHTLLTRQNVSYGIYLIEPAKGLTFNRAMLLNIGFIESLKDYSFWNCFIFHDVDLLPENPLNFYACDKSVPKQMAVAVSAYNYSNKDYFRERYFGGVNAFSKEQMKTINGFSNFYFGWGGEDDDARRRVLSKFSKIHRLPPKIGRYYANPHSAESPNPTRRLLLKHALERMAYDGLNSLKYKLISIQNFKFYTRIHVSYPEQYYKSKWEQTYKLINESYDFLQN